MSILETLKERFPQIQGGLKQGELCAIISPRIPLDNSGFVDILRSRKLEAISREISNNTFIHERVRNDAIAMNRRTYEFLVGSPELYPYYVHNIFRDIIGVEKLYDYEVPPITKVTVPDLPTASVYIDNFKFIMADQQVKIPYKVKKTLVVNQGNTTVILELITFD